MARKKPYYLVKWPVPAEVAKLSKAERLRYWALAAEEILKAKDADLAAGLAADGKPLGRPSERWLRRRRSKMLPGDTPGDPTAPLFQPGNEISRVRSLLTARGYDGYVRVWWRFDANIGDEWGVALAHWADLKGARWDVIGMPAPSIRRAMRETNRRWQSGLTPPPASNPPPIELHPIPIEHGGRRPTTLDIQVGDKAEIARAAREGRFSGWMTPKELEAFWREGRPTPDAVLRNPARTAQVVRNGVTNRGLEHTWKVSTIPPARPKFNLLRRAWNWFFAQIGV